ncbi:MAG: hypothetical protein HY343_00785 [Lentisphaerae bacterium]|nr:hypothetical protein [Lentisphaerota bacterium]
MNSKLWSGLTAAVVLGLVATSGYGQNTSGINVMGRYHSENATFTDLPFGNGDISYHGSIEYGEKMVTWQLGADYSPDVSGTRDAQPGVTNALIDYVVTPQLHLLLMDGPWRGGVGILSSYVQDMDDEGDWIGPYGQVQLGFQLPIYKKIALRAAVYYTVESIGSIYEFGFGDLEYGAGIHYPF